MKKVRYKKLDKVGVVVGEFKAGDYHRLKVRFGNLIWLIKPEDLEVVNAGVDDFSSERESTPHPERSV